MAVSVTVSQIHWLFVVSHNDDDVQYITWSSRITSLRHFNSNEDIKLKHHQLSREFHLEFKLFSFEYLINQRDMISWLSGDDWRMETKH